ncbi:hypothetical protein NUU61_006848 [Penicillium alfredii]|uniref:pectin lyase n=1 Tax=Penicillium alfredii TaxID=1506179 RepID=A0A9W9K3Q2_9EURO|nr:uncharacterized protein NUU61_006848 [Penicillium alfredii]KAJ5091978.1 hypothetical protein NUU61_006848 [Penicillium alfredii]
MRCTALFAALASHAAAVSVSGAAEGFAKGITGGGSATAVYPSTNAELITYLKDSSPRVIVLSKTFGSPTPRALDRAASLPSTRVTGAPTTSRVRHLLLDNAGMLGMTVASDKTIIGEGSSGVIKGKRLRFVSGASNIIIQYLSETSPSRISTPNKSGVEMPSPSTTPTWCGLITLRMKTYTARIGRQHIVLGTDASKRVTISNSYINGKTDYSVTCDGYHYWGIYLAGSSDLVTMKGNYIYHTSGRSPKVQGNTLLHAVNNYCYDSSGRSFEIGSGGYILAEGNVFQNIPTVVESPIEGQLFSSPSTSANQVCSTYLGRVCQVNGSGSSGTFSQVDTAFLTNLSGKNIASASAYSVVQLSVPSNAGQGKL